MKRLLLSLFGLAVNAFPLFAQKATQNPWLDSTQVNQSKTPICIANGVIVSPNELNVDFIISVDVKTAEEASKDLGQLAQNGCVYITADQQFDVITPLQYRAKKIPTTVPEVVYMVNGFLVTDTLKISKAAIRKVDILSGSGRSGVKNNAQCLSIWTLTDEERGLPRPKNQIRIRGERHEPTGR